MNRTVLRWSGRQATVLVAAVALCSTFASNAAAACPSSVKPRMSASARSFGPSLGVQALHQASPRLGYSDGPDWDTSIVGLWKIDFVQDGQVTDEGFDAWHADGTETLNDSAPPSIGNVCLGVWEKAGKSTYKLKHLSWNYDETGKAIGVVVIRELVTLDRGGNSYHGPVTFEIYDMHENLLFQGSGEVRARRITVD